MDVKNLPQYELIQQEDLYDIQSKGYLLRHKKSGARVMLIENDDENKVFNIAFRTPPSNSTGVAHILEHSVLCGSKEFPLKDPFVELAKGSLNTFLNAMTYPDKTMYPVASCNEQDFKNLMHVYLDAVFFPKIYEKEEIFRQEGWSYQLESLDAPLKYNGVVYNEMKGAFSSPEEVLDRTVFNSLFPSTPYGNESGGDPANIPELTYSEFLGFHSKYYHPSNSYIYLYGNMDFEERLLFLDEHYLKQYDVMNISSHIPMQPPFEKVKEIELFYPISENESEEDNTYLSYSMVVGNSLDVELNTAFEVLDYALLSAPGAPLKQILLDEKIGKDVLGSYENGIYQPFFSIVVKNANEKDKERFVTLIFDTLRKLVKEGIDQKSLAAGINYLEFRFREADYSSYPKGLMYGIDIFDSWLYDDEKPFIHLQLLKVFDSLKKKAQQGYFEELVQKYLLDNTHASFVVVKPQKGMAAVRERELEEKLAAYKASLSKEELEKMVADTEHLVQYQESEEDPGAIQCIPMLKRADIRRKAMQVYNEEKWVKDTLILHHNLNTNGIGYLNLLFDTKLVPTELVPYMGVLKSVLGYVDTKHYSYSDLFNEINTYTGGITFGLQVFASAKNRDECKNMFGIRSKALYPKLPFVFQMIEEILDTSRLEDEKRLYEIIAKLKSRLQMSLQSAGHSSAMLRATSYFSKNAYFLDQIGGIAFYQLVDELESNFEEKKKDIIEKLKALMDYIFRPENLVVSYTSDEKGYDYLEQEICELKEHLRTKEIKPGSFAYQFEPKNEGLKTSGQVQYVAKAGNFVEAGYEYTGALRILKVILSYEYLWTNIRVKGGAYGCMSGFRRTGDSFLVTYRDPHLTRSLEVFANTPEFIRGFEADEREMTKYIIGAISELDTPLTPSAKGEMSLNAYFCQVTAEDMTKEREEILDAKPEDIRRLADIVEAVIRQGNLCVIGSEEKIDKNKEIFGEVRHLL